MSAYYWSHLHVYFWLIFSNGITFYGHIAVAVMTKYKCSAHGLIWSRYLTHCRPTSPCFVNCILLGCIVCMQSIDATYCYRRSNVCVSVGNKSALKIRLNWSRYYVGTWIPRERGNFGDQLPAHCNLYRIFGISQLIGKWQQQCGLV